MLKKLCAALLSLSMICSIAVVPAAAEERSTVSQAVYLGVENYGTLDRDSMDTFTHCFWNDGVTVKYQVSIANNYKVQNVLQEGYLYDLTVAGGKVTAATLLNGDAAGTVTAISANSIQVENQTVTTDSHSAIYSISASAGLVTVKEDTLKVGDTVRVFENNGVAARIYKTFVAQPYTPPVDGTAGTKTLKNFLATALEPVGTGLYIYGGTWDWQDVGSSNQAATIGIPQSWIDFFQSQDASFTYRDKDGKDANKDAAHSYYPYGEWNQYYYAGVDCSGYVAWVLYNTMNTVSGGTGYVEGAKKMAQSCTSRGWGTLTTSFGTPTNHADSDFHPGDIFSMNGHVWICLGTCDDGSIVFMHSTPSDSKAGQPGGGVQISALNPKNTGKNCEAYRLASYYMAKFFPTWSARYDAVLKGYEDYTSFSKPECGKFSWSLDGANGSLTDPEGYASKTPAQILADLFPVSSNSGSGSSSGGNTAGNTIALPSGPDAVTGGSVSLSKTNAKAGETVTATPKASKGYEAIDLIVKDSSGKTIAVTKNADGTYSFKMPAGTVSVTPSFGKIQYYGDVPQTAYYADAVWQLRVSGIMNGKSEGVFSGGEKLNRQQLWMLLARADGKTPANMAEAKIWATGAGVSDGSAATGDISRQQLAVMLWRQAGSPQVTSEKLDNFTDAKAVADYAKMAICWAAENNILTGNNGAVSPEAPASRANAAVMLVRYLNSIA
ncbi:hypothetical protein DSECCO2_379550 [anaerobic digester metagenome]